MRTDDLIQKLKNGEKNALEEAIYEYSNLVFKVAFSVLNNRQQAEEVVNDVFMKMYINIEKFEGDLNRFKNWICTISKYTAIDKHRKEKRHGEMIDIDDTVIKDREEVYEKVEVREEVKKLKEEINNMKERDREIFIRRFYYDEKISDIAKKLNMTENAVNLRILRGRKNLSEVLEGGIKNG